MKPFGFGLGALLFAAPIFCQHLPAAADPVVHQNDIVWFQLTESPEEVRALLGPPRMVAEFGTDFVSWFFQFDNTEEQEYSLQLVFRKSDGRLISAARNYDPEREVDALFSGGEISVHSMPAPFSIRVRRLSGGRLLMAMGVARPGQPTGQLMLIRDAELRFFYPWLAEELASERP